MFNRKTPEVLIVGAGPVGLFAALALTRRGIPVQIVDKGVWACSHSYALALHPQTLDLFNELGLRERILASAYPVSAIGFYDRDGRRAQIRFSGDSSMPVLRQDTLERLLEKQLHELGVRVSWKHAVSSLSQDKDRVTASIDRFEEESRGYVVARSEWMVASSTDLEVPYVIGADGYNSVVRRRLKFDYPEVGPADRYAVFEFKSDADLEHEMRIVLRDGASDVLWPVPGGYCRWGFQLTEAPETDEARIKDRRPVSNAGRLPVLEEGALRKLIAERAPWFTASIGKFTWRTIVRFERRLASGFGCGRMWLAGDAAHVTGPVGVQSMNVGFFEARDLAETLARVIGAGESPDLLTAYNERWMAVWRQLHGLNGGLCAEPQADPWVREHCGQIFSCLPAHGAGLSALAAPLGLQVR